MKCPRCGYYFKYQSGLLRHLKKKHPCEIKYMGFKRSDIIQDMDKYQVLFFKKYNQIYNTINTV